MFVHTDQPLPRPAAWRRCIVLAVMLALLSVMAAPLAGHGHGHPHEADRAMHDAHPHDHALVHLHDRAFEAGAGLPEGGAPVEQPSGPWLPGEPQWHWHEAALVAFALPAAPLVIHAAPPMARWLAPAQPTGVATARFPPPHRPPIA